MERDGFKHWPSHLTCQLEIGSGSIDYKTIEFEECIPCTTEKKTGVGCLMYSYYEFVDMSYLEVF